MAPSTVEDASLTEPLVCREAGDHTVSDHVNKSVTEKPSTFLVDGLLLGYLVQLSIWVATAWMTIRSGEPDLSETLKSYCSWALCISAVTLWPISALVPFIFGMTETGTLFLPTRNPR